MLWLYVIIVTKQGDLLSSSMEEEFIVLYNHSFNFFIIFSLSSIKYFVANIHLEEEKAFPLGVYKNFP